MRIKPKITSRIKRIFTIMSMCVNVLLFAPSGYAQSLGDVATNILGPLTGASHIVKIICVVAGTGLILGSLMRYKAHRENPIEVRLGTPIAMLIAGLALILISLIPMPTTT